LKERKNRNRWKVRPRFIEKWERATTDKEELMSYQQVNSHLAVWDLNQKTGCISLQTTTLTVLSPLSAEDFQSLLAVLRDGTPVFWDAASRRLQAGNLTPTPCTGAGHPCACAGSGPDCTALGLPGQPQHCTAGPDCTSPGQPNCTGPGHPGQPDCSGTGPNCTVQGAPDRPCTVAGKPDAGCTQHKPSCPGFPA